MSGDSVSYIDSSAIVKLIVEEAESVGLKSHLHGRRPLVSSALARTEVKRAVLALGSSAVSRASDVLKRVELIRINNRVLDEAGSLHPEDVRSLDAIHLATAALLGATLGELITYDIRMASAAKTLGWNVTSPL